jgi:hypothetical protein
MEVLSHSALDGAVVIPELTGRMSGQA